MRSFFCLFVFFVFKVSAQSVCSFTVGPAYSFYSNGSVSFTAPPLTVYICGKNTTVYDTVLEMGCQTIYMEENTILYFNGLCPSLHSIFAKKNATVNLIA